MDIGFGRVVDALPGLVWTALPDGRVDFVNLGWRDYTGLRAEQAHGQGWLEAIHPDDRPRLREDWRAMLASGAPRALQARLRRFDGRGRWHVFHANPLTDPSGRIVKWCGTAVDIEDRKRAEDLHARERHYRRIADSIPALIAFMTPAGKLESVNQHVLDYFGAALEELMDWAATDAVHPDDRAAVVAAWMRSAESGEPYEIEHRMRRADGVYRWFHVHALPLRDAEGRIARWYVLQTDIDDRKKAEALLAGEKRVLEMVSSGNPLPAVLTALCLTFEEIAGDCTCSVVLVSADGAELRQGASPSLPAAFMASVDGRPVSPEHGPCATASYLNAQVICADVGSETRWRAYGWPEHALAYGLQAVFSTPITSRSGKVIGSFALHYHEPTTPTPVHQNLIEQFTHLAGIAIERDLSHASLTQALDEVQKSEQRLRTIIDAIPTSVWCARADGGGEFWNKRWQDYSGCAPAETDDDWTAIVHPEDIGMLDAAVRASLASGNPGKIEARMRRFDGEYRWFLSQWEPLRDETGAVVNWYGSNTDIEDRKQAEALLAGEKQFLEMAASGRSMSEILDALCRLVENTAGGCYCSVVLADPAGARLAHGAAPRLPASLIDVIVGRPIVADSGPCPMAACLNRQIISTDLASETRWTSGAWLPMALAHGLRACWSTPIPSSNGKVLGAFAIYYDEPRAPTPLHLRLIEQFTHIASIAIERAQGDAALRRSEAFLAEAQRLSATGSFSWDMTTDDITWSEQAYRIFGFDPGSPVTLERIIGRVHPEDIPRLRELIGQARAGGDFEYEHRLLTPDGAIKHLHLVARAVRDPGSRSSCIGAIQDVTERRLSEEALGKIRSELEHVTRVMSLGALTASIAHEVNQPLAGIITNASTCLRMLAADPPNIDGARETARRTIRDGHRASGVITRLRAFFGKTGAPSDAVDLNEATREVVALCWTDLQRNQVNLRTELGEDLPHVTGDRIQLQQVILNLVVNASDAMRDIDDRPRELVIRTERAEGEQVILTVIDAGVGFGPQDAEKLFDAFYSTKDNGMGMGLSVSRSIIENHHGRLWAAPNDGAGATFSFTIPVGPGGKTGAHGLGAVWTRTAPIAERGLGNS